MRSFFMSYVQGEDRGQAALLPAAIEDYVVVDAPVRVIDAFVALRCVRCAAKSRTRLDNNGQTSILAPPTRFGSRGCAFAAMHNCPPSILWIRLLQGALIGDAT